MDEGHESGAPVALRDTIDSEPWAFYERLQQEGVLWNEDTNSWLVGSYDLVRSILRQDERVFRRPKGDGAASDPYLISIHGSPRDITLIYGEDHTRFHRWWFQAVSRANCERWRATRIRPVVDAVVDQFAHRGHAELVEEFATQVPIRVVASILGLPWQDDEWMDSCHGYLQERGAYMEALMRVAVTSDRTSEVDEIGRTAMAGVDDLVEKLMPYAERAMAGKDLGDDLISMYGTDGPDIFPDWGMDDMMAGIMTAFFAGTDTTGYAVANGIHILADDFQLQDDLRAGGEDALAAFVEEALRIRGILDGAARGVTRDIEIGGVDIEEGSVVVPMVSAANLDPSHYECPYEVRLDRENPRDHMAFWMGPRACGGMWLARAELLEMYTALVERLPNLRLNPDAEQPRLRGWLPVRSWRPLHVLFDAR